MPTCMCRITVDTPGVNFVTGEPGGNSRHEFAAESSSLSRWVEGGSRKPGQAQCKGLWFATTLVRFNPTQTQPYLKVAHEWFLLQTFQTI